MPTAALLDWLPGGKRVLTVTAGYEFTLLLADDNLLFAVCGTGQLGRGHSNADDPRPRYSRVPHPVTGVGLERISSRVGEEPFRIAVLQHSMVCRPVEASRQRAAGRKPSPPPRRFVQPQPRRADDDGAGGASAAPRQPIDNPIDVAMMVLKTLSGELPRPRSAPPSFSLALTHRRPYRLPPPARRAHSQ